MHARLLPLCSTNMGLCNCNQSFLVCDHQEDEAYKKHIAENMQIERPTAVVGKPEDGEKNCNGRK